MSCFANNDDQQFYLTIFIAIRSKNWKNQRKRSVILMLINKNKIISGKKIKEVPPRFELGSLDSKSRVLTITPWDHVAVAGEKSMSFKRRAPRPSWIIDVVRMRVT